MLNCPEQVLSKIITLATTMSHISGWTTDGILPSPQWFVPHCCFWVLRLGERDEGRVWPRSSILASLPSRLSIELWEHSNQTVAF